MVHETYPKSKRKRLSTSGSYHSAVEESDYENDIGIEELEEAEKELMLSKNSFEDDPQISRSERKQRPYFTIPFLLGVICALVSVIVIDYVKNGIHRAPPTHFELIPHLESISNFQSEDNWTGTQLVKQKQNSISRTMEKSSEGKRVNYEL